MADVYFVLYFTHQDAPPGRVGCCCFGAGRGFLSFGRLRIGRAAHQAVMVLKFVSIMRMLLCSVLGEDSKSSKILVKNAKIFTTNLFDCATRTKRVRGDRAEIAKLHNEMAFFSSAVVALYVSRWVRKHECAYYRDAVAVFGQNASHSRVSRLFLCVGWVFFVCFALRRGGGWSCAL